jgi:general secretion pathway protein D
MGALVFGAPLARAAETPGSRLDREVLARQDNIARSRAFCEVGRRYHEARQHVKARGALQRAVQLDPNNKEAIALLTKVNDALGVRMPAVKTSLEELKQERLVLIQEKLVELENLLRGAEAALQEASAEGADATLGVERLLAAQVRLTGRSQELAERAREIMKWMPSDVDVSEHEKRARDYIRSARDIGAQKLAQLRQEKVKLSIKRVEQQKLEERKQEERVVEKLLDQVQLLFDSEEFVQAEKLAEEVLRIAPSNLRATELWASARETQHRKREAEFRTLRKEEKINLDEALSEAGIPYSGGLVYAKDWKDISKRASVEMAEAAEPEWKRMIARKLDRKVTFEFVDTPLSEALQFLQTLTETTIILDPRAFDAGGGDNTPITLKVTNMPLRTALKWILRLADLDFTLKNEAVFISTPQNLAGEVELKIYDVRDLTYSITNFPGPELIMTTATGGGGMGGMGGMGDPITLEETPPEVMVEAGSLAELIMSRVAPTKWDAALGTSIEERNGKLVVMQEPEVHRLIAQLLRAFRESQTLQVTVQARFIEVRDSFLEDIGIEFADIPQDAAAPDWGSLWPGAPTDIATNMAYDHPFALPFVSDEPGMLYYDQNPDGEYDYWVRSTAFTNRVYPFGSRLPEDSPAGGAAGEGAGAVFQFRFIGNVYAQAILHAVKKEEKGDLLLAPKITMYNNQRAYIMSAVQRAYISDYDISGAVYDPVISTIMTGTVLDVRPTVSHDRRYITMNMQPGTADHLQFQIRSIVGGIAFFPIYLPSIRFRSVRTTITVPDGGTLLVSGLMTDVKFDASSGIPFFSDLPVVGRLFGTDSKQREKLNLLILCTANLLLFEEEEAEQL